MMDGEWAVAEAIKEIDNATKNLSKVVIDGMSNEFGPKYRLVLEESMMKLLQIKRELEFPRQGV